MPAAGSWLGRSIERFEDAALLTGRGRYIDDLGVAPGTLHAAILRHPLSKLAITCGQHSLHVFCLGILLSVLGRFIVMSVSNSVLMQLAVNVAGLGLMIALAQLMSWYKKKSRPPAPAPAAQARMAS